MKARGIKQKRLEQEDKKIEKIVKEAFNKINNQIKKTPENPSYFLN